MYSIIIPTLWKSKRTLPLLNNAIQCPYIKEIILINNAPPPEEFNLLSASPKLVVIDPEENLYVNPSWNLGVSRASFDDIIICNDDIEFDLNLYFYLLNQLNLKNKGFIGMSAQNYSLDKPTSPLIKPYEPGTYGWGCLIAFHKDNWVPIPEELKIWCGDSFMIEVNPAPSNTLHGFPVKTEMSTTSDLEEFNETKNADVQNWIKYLSNLSR